MKTYKKPNSIVIEIAPEDIMDTMKASGGTEVPIDPGTGSTPTPEIPWVGEAPGGSTAGSKDFGSWE